MARDLDWWKPFQASLIVHKAIFQRGGHGGESVDNVLAGWMWVDFWACTVIVKFGIQEAQTGQHSQALKFDRIAGAGLGTLGAKSGDRSPPKMESKMPGHRDITVTVGKQIVLPIVDNHLNIKQQVLTCLVIPIIQ